jgi:oxygen-dependent protoporphyrinogen oxidase
VFGAPGTEIGVRAAFPQAVGTRSLARALRRRPGSSSPAEPQFLAVDAGFRVLVDALAAELPPGAVRTGTSMGRLGHAPDGRFSVDGDDLPADAVLLATTADAAARSLSELAPEAAAAFGRIRYGGSAVIALRFPKDSLVRTQQGSGFLVDPEEGLATAACSWYSTKWPHLTGGQTVLRAVVTHPARLAMTDQDLLDRVGAEIGHVMGARAEPDLVRMRRWDRALPVFPPGHHQAMRQAIEVLPERVAVAGAFLGAVGIPDCVESGESAARRLVAALAPGPGRR